MRIHEFQAKRLFAQHGIPQPRGGVATTPAEARAVAEEIGGAVAVKAQVLVGGRGKAGGIRIVTTPDEAERAAAQILGMRVAGLPVRVLLVEQAEVIQREVYLAVTVDRFAGRPLAMVSSQGGVDIEEVARKNPQAILRLHIDPCVGLRPYQALALAKAGGLGREHHRSFEAVARGLYEVLWANDARLAEINPLVVVESGALLAVDAKVVLDDNALFRHPELESLRSLDEETDREREAREAGISYVDLGGDIGCMVNGAGLAMATMDAVKLLGGSPANFLDIGGGARAETVSRGLSIILSEGNVRAVLVNIFGGITRCDEVAAGLVSALKATRTAVPVVARLVGTNEAEGTAIVKGSHRNVVMATTLSDAARRAIRAARDSRNQ